ncbi:MAG: M20 family metallopeptidase [Chloroflexota bacterium]
MTQATSTLLDEAREILPDVIEMRRRLHRIPEIGLELPKTQAVVVEELRRLGLEPKTGELLSSVTAVIEGERPGPAILLRADMDALPVAEDTGLDFASEHPDVMHACGHDTHVAMLLGAVRLLLARRADLAGRVVLMFQPGEEGQAGANFMLEEGLLDEGGGGIERAFAIHTSTRYASGRVELRSGPMLAAADMFWITVIGRGGHASTPHLALDPIPAAAEIVTAIQTMVTRRVDAFDPAIVTVAYLQAGTTTNIIPETAVVAGTIRTVSEETRSTVHASLTGVAEGIAAAHGASVDVGIQPGYPVTRNNADFTTFVREIAVDLVGQDAVGEPAVPVMGAEDFSYVLQKVPGTFAFIGARPAGEDPVTAPQNHSNRVVFDEPPMAVGAALHAAVALGYLGRR